MICISESSSGSRSLGLLGSRLLSTGKLGGNLLLGLALLSRSGVGFLLLGLLLLFGNGGVSNLVSFGIGLLGGGLSSLLSLILLLDLLLGSTMLIILRDTSGINGDSASEALSSFSTGSGKRGSLNLVLKSLLGNKLVLNLSLEFLNAGTLDGVSDGMSVGVAAVDVAGIIELRGGVGIVVISVLLSVVLVMAVVVSMTGDHLSASITGDSLGTINCLLLNMSGLVHNK